MLINRTLCRYIQNYSIDFSGLIPTLIQKSKCKQIFQIQTINKHQDMNNSKSTIQCKQMKTKSGVVHHYRALQLQN